MTDPPLFEHHFTLAEANALLPWIAGIFDKVAQLLSEIDTDPQPALAGAPSHANGHANGYANGHANGKAGVQEALNAEQKMELVNALLAEILDRGIVIQDPRRRLIDFPAWRGEQEIFLCYEQTDGPVIRAWHGLNAGYAGRRPLDELNA